MMDMKGVGMMYVQSAITSPELTEKTFWKWYDDIHIKEILEDFDGAVTSAIRYKNVDPKAEMPYLSTYEVPDIAYLVTPKFGSISVKSDLLPGSGVCYEVADFDQRYYNAREVQEHANKGKGGWSLYPEQGLGMGN